MADSTTPEEPELTETDLVNAVRAGKPANVDTRTAIVRMLYQVKTNQLDPEGFYKEVSRLDMPEGQELRHTLMEIKKDVGNYLGEKGLNKYFGEIFASGATGVEARILTHRKDVVFETIKKAIVVYRDNVRAATGENPKFTFYYGEVGGWPGESFEEMKFAGDIDFNFLAGDLDAAMELKKIFDGMIVERYGRTPEDLDIPCTVHGMATSEVYVGKHGQSFAEDVTKIAWEIDFEDAGPNMDLKRNPVQFREALETMVLEADVWKASNSIDDLQTLKWPYQPGISLEMIRHFEHDIAGLDVFTDLESFVKAAKYTDRAYSFLIKELGDDARFDPLLKDTVEKLTKFKKDPKAQVRLIKEYFKKIGKPLPFEVDLEIREDGKGRATIEANKQVISDFWDVCRTAMWDGANQVLRQKTESLKRRVAALGKDDPEGSKRIYDELVKLDEMLEVEDRVLNDKAAGLHDNLDPEYVRLMSEFRSMRGDFKQKVAAYGHLDYIDPKIGKTYRWVETMLNNGHEFNIHMAGGAIMALPGRVNNFLDFLDDGLLGKFRDGGGEEYIRILRQGQGYYWGEQVDQFLKGTRLEGRYTRKFNELEVSYGAQFKKAQDWLNNRLQGKLQAKGLKLIQGVNTTFSQSVAGSSAGQATMTGLMLYNLKDELPAYYAFLETGDWEGLATEFFKRRVPFGSAVERGMMGDYMGVAVEVTFVLVPPLALVSVGKSIGQFVAEQGFEIYFDEEMDTFIDSLYEKAKFKIIGVETAGDDIKISKWRLESVTYNDVTFDYDELIRLERDGHREMESCLHKPREQRIECFPLEKVRDGLFQWFPTEQVFRNRFHKTDPWLQVLDEMEKAPRAGEKLKEHYRFQKYTRLEQIKVEFLERTREMLEKRRSGEQAHLSGDTARMYDELIKIASALDIRPQLEKTIDEQFGGAVTQFFTWMKDYMRGTVRYMYGKADVWDVYEELSAVIVDNLSIYQKILNGREQAEKLLTINNEDQGLRLLVGPYFLTGDSRTDAEASKNWIDLPSKVRKQTINTLEKIKEEEKATPPELDFEAGSFDLATLNRIIYHDSFGEMWKQVNSMFINEEFEMASYLGKNPSLQAYPNEDGVMSDQDRAQMRSRFHRGRVLELLQDFREHYRSLREEEDEEFRKKLRGLESLLAAIQSLREQATESNTELETAATELDEQLASHQTALETLSTDIANLRVRLAEESPNAALISDETRRYDPYGARLAEIRRSIEDNTLSTCRVFELMEATDDVSAFDDLLAQARRHFKNTNRDYESYEEIQAKLDAAQNRVAAEQAKQNRADGLIGQAGLNTSGLRSLLAQMTAQQNKVRTLATTIQGLDAQAKGIVAQAEEIVESAERPEDAEDTELSDVQQATVQEMGVVLNSIRGVQGAIGTIVTNAATRRDALSASILSAENATNDAETALEELKEAFTGEVFNTQVEQALTDFQSSVDAANVFIDPIIAAIDNADTCMMAILKQYDSRATREAQTAAVDCSAWPNTQPSWDASVNQYRCVCVDGYLWDPTQAKCVTPQQVTVDCSAWPNTRPQWDASISQHRCVCADGYLWDPTQAKCVTPQQVAVDCSGWPNTRPQWDASINQHRCVCVDGYLWDPTQAKCVTPQQVAVDCSAWPNTRPQWDASINQHRCVCVDGTQWDSMQGRCVAGGQQQGSCSQWPGTVAQTDAFGQARCVCPGATSWDSSRGRCVDPRRTETGQQQPVDCSQWPGSVAQSDGFGGYNCVCPQGTEWNAAQGRCLAPSTSQPQNQGTPHDGTCPDGSVAILGICYGQTTDQN